MEVRKLTKARLQGRLQFARPEKLEEMRAGKTRSKRSRGKRGNTAPKEAPVPEELPRPSSGEADDAPKRGRSRRRRSSIFRMRREIKETATSDDDLHGTKSRAGYFTERTAHNVKPSEEPVQVSVEAPAPAATAASEVAAGDPPQQALEC